MKHECGNCGWDIAPEIRAAEERGAKREREEILDMLLEDEKHQRGGVWATVHMAATRLIRSRGEQDNYEQTKDMRAAPKLEELKQPIDYAYSIAQPIIDKLNELIRAYNREHPCNP